MEDYSAIVRALAGVVADHSPEAEADFAALMNGVLYHGHEVQAAASDYLMTQE